MGGTLYGSALSAKPSRMSTFPPIRALSAPRSGLGRQQSLALGADRGHIGHDLVDPLGREAMAMMSRMSGLTAGLAPARGLAHRLGGTQLAEGGIEELDEF